MFLIQAHLHAFEVRPKWHPIIEVVGTRSFGPLLVLAGLIAISPPRPALIVIAVLSLAIAVAMPLLEFVPFSATIAGVIFTGFGLSLMAHDGVVGVTSVLMTGGIATLGLVLI